MSEKGGKRRKCIFNASLQAKYPFIHNYSQDESEVQCSFCASKFSVAHGGNTDIQCHINSTKHKNSAKAVASTSSIKNFCITTSFNETTKKVLAAEGTWAYHLIQHNHSFRSADCTSKLINVMFEPKYSSARTKSNAIISGVFEPMTMQTVEADLNSVNFITVCWDASNHKNTKLMPILVRFFLPSTGIQLKILELKDIPGETADLVSEYVINVITNFNINDKVIGLCADNTNSNFGGAARKGANNVYTKIKKCLDKPNLVGIGCMAHIINNCIKTACDILPVDIETFILKVFYFFNTYTVRVEKLKEFCEFVDIEHKNLLGYSNTRWLALLPAIERQLKLYPALKSYFMSIEKCPTLIKNFFNNPETEFWLLFVHNVASLFHKTVLLIQSSEISALESLNIFKDLKQKIAARKEESYIPIILKNMLKTEDFLDKQHTIEKHIFEFYLTAEEYLRQWENPDCQNLETFRWVLLQETPQFSSIQPSLEVVSLNNSKIKIDEDGLFDETTCIKQYVTEKKIEEWQASNISVSCRWTEIFNFCVKNKLNYYNTLLLVEFALCLPGTNAELERVFSIINNIWTAEKSQLKVDTLKSMIITRVNNKLTCLEFYKALLENEMALKSISSQSKYKFK